MPKLRRSALTVALVSVVAAWACAVEEPPPADELVPITAAIAVLLPTDGHDASGIVRFGLVAGGMQVTAQVGGLTPGLHGFHIHQLGDCSAPDGTSAGGHFNPEDMPHGDPLSEERHVGDLGNLNADSSGTAHFERTDRLLAFEGPRSIVGRAVIVHAEPDDARSQPTGAAGGRVACGVIGIAQ